jgi:hypothetical protein
MRPADYRHPIGLDILPRGEDVSCGKRVRAALNSGHIPAIAAYIYIVTACGKAIESKPSLLFALGR